MKNFSKNLLFISLIATTLIVAATSCKDDTDCKMIVHVKLFGDTTVVIPYAQVHVHQGDIHVWGSTDVSGNYEHTFALEAIYNVTITDSVITDSTVSPPLYLVRTGEGTVRLKPGETAIKTILVK